MAALETIFLIPFYPKNSFIVKIISKLSLTKKLFLMILQMKIIQNIIQNFDVFQIIQTEY